MNISEAAIVAWLSDVKNAFVVAVSSPAALIQIGVILAAFIVARPVGGLFERRLERRARGLRTSAGVLRLVVATLRRMRLVVFVAILWIVRLALLSANRPAQSGLIIAVLYLATAWLVIGVLTRIIRNRTLSRLVALAIWCYVAVKVVGIEHPVVTALDRMAIDIGTFHLSALFVIKIVAVTMALFWFAVFSGNFIENRISRTEDLSPSLKVLLAKLAKIALIAFAGAIALRATGIDLTALTVFSGAVGVGVGLGLQKVVSNFLSGIIILLDKSIKPGDTIELGDTFGWIRELRARFVSVITRDGREYLIPNEDLIAQRVINWSFSSDLVRINVEFGVAYDSNPHEVSRIAIEAARGVPRVIADQAPVCWLTAFGDSSLDFTLRFWIHDPQAGLTNIRGQVLLALWDAFQEAGIRIPFPHREILMHTPVEVTRPERRPPNHASDEH
ncbi:mechanosensitive ion channel family protein [Pararhizobium mangrovi]|uniref:Mechanosensitive ion channel n=1 Tax=Pararhizobium mangrovi TaxID=2590452 RepID=A0A506UD41_9HYPH|nr:mechanosensitive ion channel domain-containing protein [Pararhizobium mangrovi]TPW31326.1 mechanosensitive ion channel [Pararhizobium mangrovi]